MNERGILQTQNLVSSVRTTDMSSPDQGRAEGLCGPLNNDGDYCLSWRLMAKYQKSWTKKVKFVVPEVAKLCFAIKEKLHYCPW